MSTVSHAAVCRNLREEVENTYRKDPTEATVELSKYTSKRCRDMESEEGGQRRSRVRLGHTR